MVVDDVTRNFPKLSSQPDVGRWYSVSPEGARSSDGSEWHGLVRMGTENKVVVFFFGGGVSLDEGMSRSNARTMSFAPTVAWQDYFVDSGIFSKSPENPFRNWTFLVLEYATGDFHAGTNEYRYVDDEGNGQVVYHAGFVNYSLFMDEVLPVVGEPDTLLVTGSSAGGFATSLLADDVIARFPSAASVTACVDSALLRHGGAAARMRHIRLGGRLQRAGRLHAAYDRPVPQLPRPLERREERGGVALRCRAGRRALLWPGAAGGVKHCSPGKCSIYAEYVFAP